jgi:hypothetical protein
MRSFEVKKGLFEMEGRGRDVIQVKGLVTN